MNRRIVEVSQAAHLSLQHRQLVVHFRNGNPIGTAPQNTVPIEDLGLLILDHPAISYSQQLLTAASENNVAIILCNNQHLPTAMLLPFVGNSLQTKFLATQSSVPLPRKKRLWQVIVRAKIRAQARTLQLLGLESGRLREMVERVRSGDAGNLEAQAARLYWKQLFGKDFQRGRELGGANKLLNYGYMVMRAAVARAIVGAGLHPSLGIHHCNQYNGFCLADDLVEPLRPLIDLKAHGLMQKGEGDSLQQSQKARLLASLYLPVVLKGDGNGKQPLLTALHIYTAGVRKAITGEIKAPPIPEL